MKKPLDLCRVKGCERRAMGCEPVKFSDGTRLRVLQRDKSKRFCSLHSPEVHAHRVAVMKERKSTCDSIDPTKSKNRCLIGRKKRRVGVQTALLSEKRCMSTPTMPGLPTAHRFFRIRCSSKTNFRMANTERAA